MNECDILNTLQALLLLTITKNQNVKYLIELNELRFVVAKSAS